MRIRLANQLPIRLEPAVRGIAGPLDPVTDLRERVVRPLLTPLPGTALSVVDDQGAPVSEDDVLALVERCMTGVVDDEAEETVRDLLRQSLVHFSTSATSRADELFANQAASAARLPLGPTFVYTADADVVPSAKELLTATTDRRLRDAFFASLAYTYRPPTGGAWFASEEAYRRFAQYLDAQAQAMSAALDPDVLSKLGQVRDLPMDGLTESLLLRVDESDDLDPLSFSRLLVYLLDQYVSAHPEDAGTMPFLLSEHLLPMSLVLVNVERTARATAQQLNREWSLIERAVNSPIKVLSKTAISRLDTFVRAQAAAQTAATRLTNAGKQVKKAQPVKLRATRPTSAEVLADVRRLLKRFRQVALSHNVIRAPATTFAKANRRDPRNYNLPGKTVRTRFLPDIHVFLDTSGSISEDDYRDSVMMMIGLAKRLDVDLYLSSFSHELSAETLVLTKGRSRQKVWNAVQRIPKVSGGTDFVQIWRYVNASPVRRRRLSVVVTDFGFRCPTQYTKHPANLVYTPCSHIDWDVVRSHAEDFARSAQHVDTRIAKRFLGMAA